MTNPILQVEFTYTNSDPIHHHAYLLPLLLEMLAQKAIASPKPLQILDLGCGNGSLSQRIAQQGYRVVGVESSTSGFQFARLNYSECEFIQASVYDLPYAKLEHSFDVVIAVEVVEHLFDPKALVRAAKRCLKPGGQLILTTPYHGYWKNLAIALLGKTDEHFTALWDGGHIKFFSVKTLGQLLKQEGFTQAQFKFAGRVPYLWKSMLCSSINSSS